jgi:hypothetical protein
LFFTQNQLSVAPALHWSKLIWTVCCSPVTVFATQRPQLLPQLNVEQNGDAA